MMNTKGRTGTVQAPTETGLFRGAQAVADYLNSHLVGGKKLTRAAVYRMVEDEKFPVIRLGEKRSEIWARKSDIDRLLGLEPDEETAREAA
jgi:predicted DNA-binding transcriptional regulator AlpA